MIYATLTYQLPDEATEHLCAVQGPHMHSVLSEINERLRSLLKHGGIQQMTATQLAEELRAEICEALALVES